MHQALLEFLAARLVWTSTRRVVVQRCPAVPDRAEDDGRHRQIQVRGLIDDDGVVAAEFEQALAEARRQTSRPPGGRPASSR